MKRTWNEYLYIASALYLVLGFFNILFAWLGLFCFFIPLLLTVVKGDKRYCNNYCGRGQLFQLLGGKLGLSRKKDIPAFLRSKWFRYGFLAFFMTMFGNMLFVTYLVFARANTLRTAITVLWTFRLPWDFAYMDLGLAPWVSQFAFGFYSVMFTSTILGLITMLLYKPRSWCVYCPMGTMTQMVCYAKSRK